MSKLEDLNHWRHIEFGDVSSTSDICFEKARAGEKGGLWVTADRQLGGRGRRGRAWVSEPGNLYSSLFLLEEENALDFFTLPLAIAVAVSHAIDSVLPIGLPKTKIKWPNDILIDGAKVAGILLETELLDDGRRAIIIGCGVNISHSPDTGMYPTIAINSLGASVSPQQLFAKFYTEIPDILGKWQRGNGIGLIRELWLEKAAGIGDNIKVNLPHTSLHGLFVGLASNGSLILRDEDGEDREISAGDVFFPTE